MSFSSNFTMNQGQQDSGSSMGPNGTKRPLNTMPQTVTRPNAMPTNAGPATFTYPNPMPAVFAPWDTMPANSMSIISPQDHPLPFDTENIDHTIDWNSMLSTPMPAIANQGLEYASHGMDSMIPDLMPLSAATHDSSSETAPSKKPSQKSTSPPDHSTPKQMPTPPDDMPASSFSNLSNSGAGPRLYESYKNPLQEEKERLEARVAALENEKKRLTRRNGQLEGENKQLTGRNVQLEAISKHISERNRYLDSVSKNLHSKIQGLIAKGRIDQENIGKLSSMLNKALPHIKDLNHQIRVWQYAYQVLNLQRSSNSQSRSAALPQQIPTSQLETVPQAPPSQQMTGSQLGGPLPQGPPQQQMQTSQPRPSPQRSPQQQIPASHPKPAPQAPPQQRIPASQPKPAPQRPPQQQKTASHANPKVQAAVSQPTPQPKSASRPEPQPARPSQPQPQSQPQPASQYQSGPSKPPVPRCRKQMGTWYKSAATQGLCNAIYPNPVERMRAPDIANVMRYTSLGKRKADDEAWGRPTRKEKRAKMAKKTREAEENQAEASEAVAESVLEGTSEEISDEEVAAFEAMFGDEKSTPEKAAEGISDEEVAAFEAMFEEEEGVPEKAAHEISVEDVAESEAMVGEGTASEKAREKIPEDAALFEELFGEE